MNAQEGPQQTWRTSSKSAKNKEIFPPEVSKFIHVCRELVKVGKFIAKQRGKRLQNANFAKNGEPHQSRRQVEALHKESNARQFWRQVEALYVESGDNHEQELKHL